MRRSTQGRSPFLARLACVKHAASVQSEPGSNSSVQSLLIVLRLSESWLPDSLFNCQRPTSSPGASRQAEAGIYRTPPLSSSVFLHRPTFFFNPPPAPFRASRRKRVSMLSPPPRQPLPSIFFRRPPRRGRQPRRNAPNDKRNVRPSADSRSCPGVGGGVDSVSWITQGLRRRYPRCPRHAHLIRRCFASR